MTQAQAAGSVAVTMPKLGESVVEGTLVRWLKREGDTVAKYEPVAEVITDKVNTEIPSPAGGTVLKLLVAEGQTVPIGTQIALVSTDTGEPDGAPTRAPAAAASSIDGDVAPPPASAAATAAVAATAAGESDSMPPRTSPLVRRLAREHEIDLAQVPGTGTGGRVRKEDILAAIAHQARAAGPSMPAATPAPGMAEDEEPLPLSPVRRAIAEHMVRSLQTSPHTWTYVETDVSGLQAWRAREREAFKQREGYDLTYVPFVCKALVETLREHPILNSTWRDNQVVLKRRINLGVAVALEDNLVVPVIKDADRLSIAGMAHALNDLVTRARAGQLRPEDVQGGTFTFNNTGALGSILSQPIINQPQAAILTMEAIVKRVVVAGDDAIAIRPMMNVCISFDHRICDGLQVGRFMQALKRRIEALGTGSVLY